MSQFKSLFGKEAEEYIDYVECIWSQEENTFEVSDWDLFPHQNNGNAIFRKSIFEKKLLISSSESALDYPGYMDGAVYSANLTAQKITATYNKLRVSFLKNI